VRTRSTIVGETGGAVGGDVEEAAGTLVGDCTASPVQPNPCDVPPTLAVVSRYIVILKEEKFDVVSS
jgi:hypothetical protein